MISTRHTINKDQISDDQIAMFKTLQKQMEEMCQKSTEDWQKNEEGVSLLKEQNEESKRRIARSEHREKSCSNDPTHNQEKSITV